MLQDRSAGNGHVDGGALEDALRVYIDGVRVNPSLDVEAFLAAQPAELRDELQRAISLHASFRGALGGAAAGLRAGTRLDDFRLVRELGQGGMGTVWEAEQLSLDRRVALKVLHAHLTRSPRAVERLRREAEAGARLAHPGLVTVLGFGEADGVHYLAQERVEGPGTLADEIEAGRRAGTPIDHRAVVSRFVRLVKALDVAHRAGVVHRDVKPHNVLVTHDGGLKLADFGLARLEDAEAFTVTGELAGTPHYLSPEQARGAHAEVGARSDVWSLGATLYETLTRARPFSGDSARAVVQAILEDEPTPPRRHAATLPGELAAICMKALEKAPARRYTSAAAMADDLRRFLEHRPVAARPVGPLGRASRWSRRHPTAASLLAAAAAVVVTVAVLLGRMTGQSSLIAELSVPQAIARLNERAEAFGPVDRKDRAAYEEWLADARALVARRPDFARKLTNIRAHALPWSEEDRARDERTHASWLHLKAARDELDELERQQALPEEIRASRTGATLGFDVEYYRSMWSDPQDILTVYGDSDEGFRRHYEEYGRWEGRQPNRTSFDVGFYLEEYGQQDASVRETAAAAIASQHMPGTTIALFAHWCDVGRHFDYLPNRAGRLADLDPEARPTALREARDRVAALQTEIEGDRTVRFDDTDRAWRHELYDRVVAGLRALAARHLETGTEESLAAFGVAERVRWLAREAAQKRLDGPRAGLIELGPDPVTGLDEYWHVGSGDRPERDAATGGWAMRPETGIVFVRVPVRSFTLGVEDDVDPDSKTDEKTPKDLRMPPLLVSKYEMTRAQWARLAGRDPSFWNGGHGWLRGLDGDPDDQTRPVESVRWLDATRVLRRVGLRLPTEAEWESFAEPGACSDDRYANLRDASLRRREEYLDDRVSPLPEKRAGPDDGFTVPAPVGSLAPNGFGLHDTLGNVAEWCFDAYRGYSFVSVDEDGRAMVQRCPVN